MESYPVSSRKYLLTMVAIGLVVFVVASYILIIPYMADYASDFTKFYMSARLFLAGEDIYSSIGLNSLVAVLKVLPATDPDYVMHPNLNPPFQTLIFAPLGLLPYRTASFSWSVISLLCLMSIAFIVEKNILSNRGRLLGYSVLFLLLTIYFPTLANFLLGQLSIFLLPFLALLWVASRKGENVKAGIVLGFIINIKLFFGIFIILFALERRWKLLVWSVGAFVFGLGIGILVFGAETHTRYLSMLNGITWYSNSWNASIMGFFSRFIYNFQNMPLKEALSL